MEMPTRGRFESLPRLVRKPRYRRVDAWVDQCEINPIRNAFTTAWILLLADNLDSELVI